MADVGNRSGRGMVCGQWVEVGKREGRGDMADVGNRSGRGLVCGQWVEVGKREGRGGCLMAALGLVDGGFVRWWV